MESSSPINPSTIPSDTSQNPSTQPSLPKKNNNSLILSLFLIITLLVLLALGGLVWYINGRNFSEKPSSQNKESRNEYILSDDTVRLPLNLSDPRIFRAAISYSFIGTFMEFRDTPQGKEIVLEGEPGLPRLIVENDRTRFYWWDDVKKISASARESDIKIDSKLRINAFYSLKQGRWTTHQVFIYISELPKDATPSAIGNDL